jgi:hypothetical protein
MPSESRTADGVSFLYTPFFAHAAFRTNLPMGLYALGYCNSLFLNLHANQLDRLQLVLNSAARAVTSIPKFHHITTLLKSLHYIVDLRSLNAFTTKFYILPTCYLLTDVNCKGISAATRYNRQS